MEDEHLVSFEIESMVILGIMDGHGGKEASIFASSNFIPLLKEKIQTATATTTTTTTATKNTTKNTKEILIALKESFMEMDEQICDPQKDIFSGTTATIAIIEGGVIYTANVGDSQSFLMNSKEAIPLTQTHNPTRGSEEEERIVKEGGIVRNERVLGILAVSRSLGDSPLKPWVSAVPFCKKTVIAEGCGDSGGCSSFVILACDGLWDFVSVEQCRKCVLDVIAVGIADGLNDGVDGSSVSSGTTTTTTKTKTTIAQKSSDALLELAKYEGSDDNISIIVVIFD